MEFSETYKLLKPLYIMLLYLSSWDEYYEPYTEQEKLVEVKSWIGLDFKILSGLEGEKLLTQPTKGKRRSNGHYVSLTPQGIEEALELLNKID